MDVFQIPNGMHERTPEFIRAFLGSYDFDQVMRKKIAYAFDLEVKRDSKEEVLSTQIAAYLTSLSPNDLADQLRGIVDILYERPRRYVAFKLGQVSQFPVLGDVRRLVVEQGEDSWYGPIQASDGASWYIRPTFIPYQERVKLKNDDGTTRDATREFTLRWLCFARVTRKMISLHWSNFSAENGVMFLNEKTNTGRFPYWDYVGSYFDDLQKHTKANLQDVRLDVLLLNQVWDIYRYDKRYTWTDARIRAENRGVALTASGRATTVDKPEDEDEDSVAVDIVGIKHLAETIRNAMQRRLRINHQYELPEPDVFTEEILRTIIKRYNPKSYELRITDNEEQQNLLNAHVYFGKKPATHSPDRLRHLSLVGIRERSSIEQIEFLLRHFDPNRHLVIKKSDANSSYTQSSLL